VFCCSVKLNLQFTSKSALRPRPIWRLAFAHRFSKMNVPLSFSIYVTYRADRTAGLRIKSMIRMNTVILVKNIKGQSLRNRTYATPLRKCPASSDVAVNDEAVINKPCPEASGVFQTSPPACRLPGIEPESKDKTGTTRPAVGSCVLGRVDC
jgi:hypothetical protein